MRVGLTTFGGDGGKSGISQYIINLVRELPAVANGARFEMLGYERERETFLPREGGIDFVPFTERILHPIVNVAWHQVSLPGWCRKRRYDVLFLPAANRRVPIAAPCPTVGTVHDLAAMHIEGKYDPARMFYNRRVLPFLIRKLSQVITVSEYSKRDIVEFTGVSTERVHVIPHGVNRSLFHPGDKREASRRFASRYGVRPPYISYVSRIEHPGKNHVGLIHAFERLKEADGNPHQLVLAGSDWTRAEEVHRVAKDSPWASDIVFTGFISSRDLPDLYRGSDLFVFPSLFEGFGMPILEAMSSGVPVACSDSSSLPEVAGGAAVLFDPLVTESIGEALRRLLTDSEERGERIRLGLARAAKFTWARAARASLEVLEAAATGVRKPMEEVPTW